MLYNGIVPILVFYGTAFFVKQWFDAQHRQRLYVPAAGNGFWRQAYAAWGAVLTMLLGYVALSVFIDINLPVNSTSNLLDHIDKRLSRVLPYITAAIMYGHYRSEEEWYELLIADAHAQLKAITQQGELYGSFSDRVGSSVGGAATDTLCQPIQWHNNLPAAFPKNRVTIIALHTLIWVVWFALHSLSLIVYTPTFTALDWLLSFYDYCSIVLVFYGVAFVIKKYFLSQEWHPLDRPTTGERLRQWIRIELFAVLVILGSYIVLSVFLSQRFPYAGSPVISSFVHAWRYFFYALPYVMIAALFSYFAIRRHLKRKRLKGLNYCGEEIAEQNREIFISNEMLLTLYP
jgi:hypothetical protein